MIVVSGEALMDVFDAGPTAHGQRLDARIGGSPLNVAIGLARLRQPVVFFGGLGRGFLGDRLQQALQAEGVDLRAVNRVAAPTTLGLVGLDAHGVADYAFYGDGAADRQLTPADLVQVPAGAAAYHFGSYAMVVQPVGGTQRALVERECRRSVVTYDVNVRSHVEPDLAVWRDSVDFMATRAAVFKLSDEDFERLYPGADVHQQARRWLSAGVALVVLTRGAQGAWAWTTAGHQNVSAPAFAAGTSLVDTVGAGDSFQAALLATLAERQLLRREALPALAPETLTAVMQFAAQAAAITCSRRGADLPRRADLP
jgi:fructokinase